MLRGGQRLAARSKITAEGIEVRLQRRDACLQFVAAQARSAALDLERIWKIGEPAAGLVRDDDDRGAGMRVVGVSPESGSGRSGDQVIAAGCKPVLELNSD